MRWAFFSSGAYLRNLFHSFPMFAIAYFFLLSHKRWPSHLRALWVIFLFFFFCMSATSGKFLSFFICVNIGCRSLESQSCRNSFVMVPRLIPICSWICLDWNWRVWKQVISQRLGSMSELRSLMPGADLASGPPHVRVYKDRFLEAQHARVVVKCQICQIWGSCSCLVCNLQRAAFPSQTKTLWIFC